MIQYIIGLVLLGIMPIALIILFSNIDIDIKEKIKLNKKDIIIILVLAIGYIIITNIIFKYDFSRYVNMSILFGYLTFMSYTDQKTKLLYSIVSICMILVELSWLLVNIKNIYFSKYDLLLIPIILSLLILSKLRMLGFGDILVYIVITIYDMIYSYIPFWDIIFNLLVSNILFVIVTSIVRIVKKDYSKNQPYTMYIAIATFICNLFLI